MQEILRMWAAMEWDAVFGVANRAALAGWVVLILAPRGGRWVVTQVRALFASDPALVAGWVHYLACDLLIADRMDRAGVGRIVQAGPLVGLWAEPGGAGAGGRAGALRSRIWR